MKKYFLIAAVIHSFFFIHISSKNTLGNPDFSIKRNIPISYNIVNSRENISGAKIIQQEKTEEVAEEIKEEKTEPVKNEEIKSVPEFESKMTRDKKDIKEEEKKPEKNKKTENKKPQKKSETAKKENKNYGENTVKESNFIENSDGTYTAVSSRGIDFKILKEVSPDYPRQAEMARYNKTVIVEAKFLVGTDGSVEDIKIIKSHEKFGFDKEVIQALKKWKFKPIVYKGRNIKVYFNKEFIFTPKQ